MRCLSYQRPQKSMHIFLLSLPSSAANEKSKRLVIRKSQTLRWHSNFKITRFTLDVCEVKMWICSRGLIVLYEVLKSYAI